VWRHIAQSLQGSSHLADGTCCQDSNGVRIFGAADDYTFVACVADGAGSAKFSNVGSSLACKTMLESAESYYGEFGGFGNFEREDAFRWCRDARRRIDAAAVERDCAVRDMATTLCVVVAAANSSAFFQIGDGGIVLRSSGVYGVVFWPQSGEYANSTNFLTSDDFEDKLEFLNVRSRCHDVALLTDGLERLALRFNQQTPHPPFFDPFFNALRSAGDVAGLNDGLRSFLASASVQNRSDDDKTLIIASRHDADDAA
jgi:hypothetical protein